MTNLKATRRGGFYWKNEKPYVSVTNAVSIFDKPALRYWFGKEVYYSVIKDPNISLELALKSPFEASESAKSRGTTIHSIVEAYKRTQTVIDTIPETYKNYALAFYKFMEDHPECTFLSQEKTVFNDLHGYAGTLDVLAYLNKEDTDKKTAIVIDVKTNKNGEIYMESYLQVSAYIQALREEGLDVRSGYILALSELGTYNFKEVDYCFDEFVLALKLWKWLNKDVCKKIGYDGR